MYYLVTFDETDGNDCTVYDTIIEAPSQKAALNTLSKHIEADLKGEWTDDGSEFGYYFDCNSDCPEDCEGHGGIGLREVEAHATEKDAQAARAPYHVEYTI